MEGWSCARVREVSGLGGGQGDAVPPGHGPGGVGKDREPPWSVGASAWGPVGRRMEAAWSRPSHGGLGWPGPVRQQSRRWGDEGPVVTVVGVPVVGSRVPGSRRPGGKGFWPLSGCGVGWTCGVGTELPGAGAHTSLQESGQGGGIGVLPALWLQGVAAGGLLRGQGAGEGSQVQSALRLPRRPALTAVALGPVPVSGLKSAPPAQACPGTWPRGAGINTGKLEGLPELTRSLQLQGQG